MIVTCEECGKKYRIDTEKIKGREARFKCRACNYVITVAKPVATPPDTPVPPPTPEPTAPVTEDRPSEEVTADQSKAPSSKTRVMGLTAKFMLSLLIPLVVIYGISVYFSMQQMIAMHQITIQESRKALMNSAKRTIGEKARSVAFQIEQYLAVQPDLKKESFNNDASFKKVAMQKVGKTGYTALYQLPDADGIWRTWAHVNPKIIAIDMKKLKKPLGKNFPGFWKVYIGVKGGKESQGFYTWKDADGAVRDKFMVCTPVKGTPYIIAATTYMDEFTRPIKTVEKKARELAQETRNQNILIMGIGLVVIALIIFFYGRNLTGKIRHLSAVADRICVGELDAEVKVKGKDEIGELADAITRMRDSIRVSIDRLRRRRIT